MGHPLGGMVAAAEVCRLDERFKVGIDLDAALLSELSDSCNGIYY